MNIRLTTIIKYLSMPILTNYWCLLLNFPKMVNHWKILDLEEFHDHTGDELLLCIDADATVLKKVMTNIEETHPLGRLFDIDIIDENGGKLSHNRRKRFAERVQAHVLDAIESAVARRMEGLALAGDEFDADDTDDAAQA